jgi:hypothetical protein
MQFTYWYYNAVNMHIYHCNLYFLSIKKQLQGLFSLENILCKLEISNHNNTSLVLAAWISELKMFNRTGVLGIMFLVSITFGWDFN